MVLVILDYKLKTKTGYFYYEKGGKLTKSIAENEYLMARFCWMNEKPNKEKQLSPSPPNSHRDELDPL